jgi:uncharacterized membrane protein
MNEFGRTDVKRMIVLTVLLLWCVVMVAVRVEHTGSGYYRFLLGNLFLAGIPLFLSTCLRAADRLRFHWAIKASLFSLWLLFLPNAPYLLTDIIHLPRAGQAPLWYDLALLLSCSGTGLLLGYLSLIDVQTIVARHSSVVAGWLFALVSLGLSGFAIYLGRFLRWNSWDVITTPSLMFDLPGMLKQARPVSVTLIFGIIFVLGYISLRVLLDPSTGRSTDQAS